MAHGKPPIVDPGQKGEDLVNKMVIRTSPIKHHDLESCDSSCKNLIAHHLSDPISNGGH